MTADPERSASAVELPAPLDVHLFRQMADMSIDSFYLCDSRGRYLYVNDRACELSGFTREELLAMTITDHSPDWPADRIAEFVAALRKGPVPPFEVYPVRKDGSRVPCEISVAGFEFAGEFYMFGVLRDISERKEMDATRKSFAQRLLQTLEAERQRVARELHDDVGQALATVGVLLHTLERTAGAVPEEARPALAATQASIQQITESVARIVRHYHPADLLGLGLEETVRAHACQFAQHHGLRLELATVPVVGLLASEHELHLYRIVQEALANVARHARARRVAVRMARRGARLTVTVRDDGIGYDAERVRGTGVGLVTMHERAELMGAEFAVHTVPHQGTEVRVIVPLAASGADAAGPDVPTIER